MNKTGDRIRARRIALGLSQEELGQRVGVQKAAINKYETGVVVNLKRSMIEKLAIALDVSPVYLLDLNEENAAPSGVALCEAQIKLIEAIKLMSEEKAESLCLLLGL